MFKIRQQLTKIEHPMDTSEGVKWPSVTTGVVELPVAHAHTQGNAEGVKWPLVRILYLAWWLELNTRILYLAWLLELNTRVLYLAWWLELALVICPFYFHIMPISVV
jgi:hypothetical protein